MRAVFRRRDFRLLFVGLAASMIGDSMLMLVLAIWVNQLTGSASAAGLTLLFLAVPYLLAPLGGWLVDRVRHRPFLVVANLAAAAVMLPLLAVHGRDQLWIVFAVTALYGASFVVLDPALNGLFKTMLPDELLAEANGATQTVKQGLRLFGPIIGAGLYTVLGGPAVALVNAASFVVAAVAVALLRLREAAPEKPELHWLGEIAAGARHLAREVVLRRTLIGLTAAVFAMELSESAAFALVTVGLLRSSTFISVLVCVQGVGALVTGPLAGRVIRRLGEVGAMALGVLLLGAGLGLFATVNLPVVVVAMPFTGAGLILVNIGGITLVQRRSPHRLIGRITAAQDGVVAVAQVGSLAAGAAMVAVLNFRLIFVLICAGMLAAAGYLWFGRPAAVPETAPAPSDPGGQGGEVLADLVD
jgi:MFS family permease